MDNVISITNHHHRHNTSSHVNDLKSHSPPNDQAATTVPPGDYSVWGNALMCGRGWVGPPKHWVMSMTWRYTGQGQGQGQGPGSGKFVFTKSKSVFKKNKFVFSNSKVAFQIANLCFYLDSPPSCSSFAFFLLKANLCFKRANLFFTIANFCVSNCVFTLRPLLLSHLLSYFS